VNAQIQSEKPAPLAPRRQIDWKRGRELFEQQGKRFKEIAQVLGCTADTVATRAKREGWIEPKKPMLPLMDPLLFDLLRAGAAQMVLDEAADHMELSGFTKGRLQDEYGRVCAIGAIDHVAPSRALFAEARELLRERLKLQSPDREAMVEVETSFIEKDTGAIAPRWVRKPLYSGRELRITVWNNELGRAKHEVVAALRGHADQIAS
jgi:hypothetical protein